MSPAIQVLLENYRADIAVACENGLELDELIGLCGVITEKALSAFPHKERREAWAVMKNVMDRKFMEGVL